MMAEQILMAQVDTANQVSQLLAASGSKTFTVGKVSAVAGNAGSMITLTPSTGGSAVAVKLEGARQMADISSLVGKTVAVSKPSMMAGVGVGNNWLMLQPVKAGAAKVAASSATMLKLEGARQGMQAASLTGQKFTVAQPMMAGKTGASTLFLQPANGGDLVALKMANASPAISGMVGKTVTVGQAPMVAGGQQGAWIALKPAAGATASKVTGGAAAAKVAAPAAVKAKSVAMVAPLAKAQTVAMTSTVPAAKAMLAKAVGGGGVTAMAGMGMVTLPPGVEVEGMRGLAAKAGAGVKGAGAKAVEMEGMRNGVMAKGAATKLAAGKAACPTPTAGFQAGGKVEATTKAATVVKATPVVGVGGAKMVNVAAVSAKGGSAAGGGMTAVKGAGFGGAMGLGVGIWGTVLIGTLGAAAAYGYYRSRQIEAELSGEEQNHAVTTATAES